MSDIIDVMYRLRDMAGMAADDLRAAVAEAQAVLDKLDSFANDAEDGAQLIAASDLAPNAHALVPANSGLTRTFQNCVGNYHRVETCECPREEAAQ